jgi:hypothetical protein
MGRSVDPEKLCRAFLLQRSASHAVKPALDGRLFPAPSGVGSENS